MAKSMWTSGHRIHMHACRNMQFARRFFTWLDVGYSVCSVELKAWRCTKPAPWRYGFPRLEWKILSLALTPTEHLWKEPGPYPGLGNPDPAPRLNGHDWLNYHDVVFVWVWAQVIMIWHYCIYSLWGGQRGGWALSASLSLLSCVLLNELRQTFG